MDADDAHIGRRIRQIRYARGKSLKVVADLAGISKSYLGHIETGERSVDRRSLIAAIANALDVAPSDLTGSTLGTLARTSQEDTGVNEVRLALLAVSMNEPRGQIQPVEQLHSRALDLIMKLDVSVIGAALPALIRDLHTTADADRRDRAELLRLLALTHTQNTQWWLTQVGAPSDLSWQAAMLSRHAAERLDEPISLAISAYGTALGLLGAGAFDLAARSLSTAQLPPLVTTNEIQMAGSLALASSLVSAARTDHTEQSSALDFATELAERTGETNVNGFGFGPSNVAIWRMQCALEAGDYPEVVKIAITVNAAALPRTSRQAVYWREYGRALAHLPKRRDEAVLMLRRAEQISPEQVQRHPLTRSTLVELLSRAKRDAIGGELRGMAYRAGLPV